MNYTKINSNSRFASGVVKCNIWTSVQYFHIGKLGTTRTRLFKFKNSKCFYLCV